MLLPRFSLTVVLDNIRSSHNVGSIFRTCDGLGVEKLFLCGITAYPPNDKVAKAALGAEETVNWEHTRDVAAVVAQQKERGYHIILLEQTDESIALDQCVLPEKPMCLVIGNEVEGVSEDVLPLADTAVEIDMIGVKNSLNASVAFGIAGYYLKYLNKKIKNDV